MKRFLFLAIVFTAILTGCSSSKDIPKELQSINWEEPINEVKDELINSDYHYVKDIDINVDNEKGTINFTAVLGDATNQKTALEFAEILIRSFSNKVAMLNEDVKPSSTDSLGSIFDSYTINIGVAPLSKIENIKEWYIFDVIRRGSHKKPKLIK